MNIWLEWAERVCWVGVAVSLGIIGRMYGFW